MWKCRGVGNRIRGNPRAVWSDDVSVSYTHLDVYKRQIQHCAIRMRRLNAHTKYSKQTRTHPYHKKLVIYIRTQNWHALDR